MYYIYFVFNSLFVYRIIEQQKNTSIIKIKNVKLKCHDDIVNLY